MRTSQAYLITRLLFVPGFWGILLLLAIIGGVLKACDTKKHDYACFGEMKYDYNDPASRKELEDALARAGADSSLLQIPPCSGLGSRWYPPEVRAEMYNRMEAALMNDSAPANEPVVEHHRKHHHS